MVFISGLIVGFAGFVFGLTGFGFSLCAVPLLSLLYPVPVAVALQFPHTLLVVGYNVWKYRALIRFMDMWLMLAGATLMVPLGVVALHQLPQSLMKYCLAFLILLSVFISRSSWNHGIYRNLQKSRALAFLTGVVSGYLQGAYTTGGPPAIIYILAREKNPEIVKGFIAIYLLYLHLLTGIMYVAGGMLNQEIITLSIMWLPATMAGMYLGGTLFKHINVGGFRAAVDVLLVLTAFSLTIK